MSAILTVPADVPLLFQISTPNVGSLARKITVPFKSTIGAGLSGGPDVTWLAVVPSLFQRWPFSAKNKTPFDAVRLEMFLTAPPIVVVMGTVPAVVPFVLNSWCTCADPSFATKNSVFPTGVNQGLSGGDKPARHPRTNVSKHHGACLSTVRFPQLLAVHGLGCDEVERPVEMTRRCGCDDDGPRLMSLIRTVPASVPSLFQSSVPVPEAVAEK